MGIISFQEHQTLLSQQIKSENSMGGLDFWIIRLDESGNVIWENTIGGSGDEYHAFIEPTKGGYILGGRSDSDISGDKTDSSNGNWDYWILKLDSSEIYNGKIPLADRI
ncbi:MAG: hypothetical protein IPP86_18455 [Bacteroidetes bacterium]|nr:hypothetical protein [Bacteroidota bacterium]